MDRPTKRPQAVTPLAPTRRLEGRAGLLVLALAFLLLFNAISVAAGSPDHVVMIVGAVFVAALVSSVAGFAFSAICGALLAPVVDDPVQAVQIMLVCSAAGQAYMVWTFRNDIRWRALLPFVAGAAPGLPLGLYLLFNADHRLYLKLLGALLICYALVMLLRRPTTLRLQHPMLDGVIGFLGGITGGIAAFPGAPVTVWCGFKGWSKEHQRGLFQPFILILQVASLGLLVLGAVPAARPVTLDLAGVVALPAMMLGTMLGLAMFRRLNDLQFSKILNVFLIASGLALLL